MSESGSDLSVTRYGRRSSPRWPFVALVVVLLVIGVAWAWWAAQAQTDAAVTARVQSYEVTSDHSVVVTIQVYARDGRRATCEIYAQAQDHSIVGERVLRLAASDVEKYTEKATITTERRPVTALVRNCRAAT